jgi:uncharacterized membrane protein YidH (DUF202 family)
MSRADEAEDPGKALERTTLAWTRSGLALAAIGALILRAAALSHLTVLSYVVGGALVAGAVLLWAQGSRPYRTREAFRRDRGLLPAANTLRAIAGLTVALAVYALVLAIVMVAG